MNQTDYNTRRFGNRAAIAQPGILTIGERSIIGVIKNVGLRGAFFAAANVPETGARGMLTREGGRGIPVRVVWQAPDTGVGLTFDS